MPITPDQETVNQYVGNGIEVNFDYKFEITNSIDINVYVTPPGQDANDAADIKQLDVDYTVSGIGSVTGGVVTFFIAPDGIVTLSRDVKATIETDYSDPKTIIGSNLDDSFQREMWVAQQNKTKIDNTVIRYPFSAYVPEDSGNNVVPLLPNGYIWKGTSTGKVAAVLPDENPDCSTLRSELENNSQGTDGAGIVGYYNEETLSPTTVRDNLNVINPIVLNLSNATILESGASLIGYYDSILSLASNVKDQLDAINTKLQQVSLDRTGQLQWDTNSNPKPGWISFNTYTIGSSISGAIYSNDDAQLLFEHFWNTYNNSICPVSGGRGVTALDDWNANKTLLMPPVDDKTFVIQGNLYFAGESFGQNSVQLSIAEMPSHNHAPPTGYGYIQLNTSNVVPMVVKTTTVNNNHISNVVSSDSGGNTPHENRQPSIAWYCFVKL